jgi:trimeric autotransporter adhesin
MYFNIGCYNTAIGLASMCFNTSGLKNTAVGFCALRNNTTGRYNTAIGCGAGITNSLGWNNTFLGNGANGITPGSDNTITLGNSSVSLIRAATTTITSLSDARDKTNITSLPPNAGVCFINALRPVSFDWNMRDGGKIGIHEFGFIAQELQEAQESTGITVPNLIGGTPDKLEASPGKLLPILVKAVQDLSKDVEELKQKINS